MPKTFSQRVVEAALAIPFGRVTTYGHIARAAGGGGQAARSVTSILARAYEDGEKNIPFHRIVFAGGKVWLNNEYGARRLKLYKKEEIEVDKKTGKIKDFNDIIFLYK